jgi:hypothetical protein
MNARPFAIAVLVALAHGTFETIVLAEGANDDQEAATLFRQAKELMDEGRFAEACPKLDRSRTLDPQVGTTLNLALCYERLGKTASSWAMWLDGAAEAAAKGQRERETLARNRAGQLEARLLRITIFVAPQADLEMIELKLDGVSVPMARWGAPIPVDAGPHWVQAAAQGKRPWAESIEVDDQHLPMVKVGVLEPLPEPKNDMLVVAPGAAPDPRRTAAVVLGSAGVAALAGMSVLVLVAKSTYSNADCHGNDCLKAGVDDRDRANVEAGLATAAGAVGVAALAGAATLWFGSKPKQTAVSLQPAVGMRDWGLSVRGAW